MAVVISFLRGVNVGGRNMLPMEKLRGVLTAMGLQQVQTYVQSGNVLFTTHRRDLNRLAIEIEDNIEAKFGFRAAVVLRTLAALRQVIARNPFSSRSDVESNKLITIFLASAPDEKTREKLLQLKPAREELVLEGRELFIFFPDGMGRSKLSAAVDRALNHSGTARNWNTVTKLVELASSTKKPGTARSNPGGSQVRRIAGS